MNDDSPLKEKPLSVGVTGRHGPSDCSRGIQAPPLRSSGWYVGSRMATGLLLLVSGLEKVTAFQPMVIGSSWVLPGVVVVAWGVIELLSGWAVMTLVRSQLLRGWTTVMFSVFTIVLLVNWFSGARQCQCLGSGGTSILLMLTIDLLILTGLYFYRDRWDRESVSFSGIVGDVIENANWVTPGLLVAATLWFGSPASAIGYLSGRSLITDQSRVVLRERKLGISFAFRRALIASLIIIHAASLFADDNTIDTMVLESIAAKSRFYETQYDNMHAIWISHQTGFDGQKLKERIEFWSREGKYFRVDGSIFDATGENVVKVYRTIVRPEGYINILAGSDSDPGVITEAGSNEDGLAIIKNASWYNDGNQIESKRLYELVSAILSGGSEKLDGATHQLSKLPNGDIRDEYVVKSDSQTGTGTVILSGDHFRVLSYQSEVVVSHKLPDGDLAEQHYTGRRFLEYDSEVAISTSTNSDVVAFSLASDESNARGSISLQEVQLGPSPLEVFYPEGGPRQFTGSAWARRIAVLLVGMLCLAIYYGFRRQSAS